MADRLNISITLDITDAEDNSGFYKTVHNWSDVPYEDMLQFQALLLGVLHQMQAWGEVSVPARGPKAKSKGPKPK